MKKITLVITATIFAFVLNAQTNIPAFGGSNGIYIFNPFDPCSPKKPNAKGAVKYKLERRETGGVWQTVGVYNCPTSEGELANNYHLYYPFALGKEFTNPNNILKLWQQYNRTPRWDSLGLFFFDRVAALAMNSEFVDASAKKDTKYEYQLSELDRTDKAITSFISNQISYPNQNVFTSTPKSVSKEGTQIEAYIVWRQENSSRPVFYKVFRKDGVLGEFDLIENGTNISREKNTDKFTLTVRDRSVGANQMYFYYAVPCDAFGNEGKSSDTVMVKTFETKDILTPQYFIAENLKGKKGIRLKWKLVNTQSVAGVEVFRCDSYDGTFKKIGTATEGDTSYTDLTANPAQIYYYYLQMVDRFQGISFRTPRTSALLEDLTPPRPPRYVTAAVEGSKVKLTWATAEKNIAGYYVYRSIGQDSAYHLISPFIQAKDSATTYFDETNNLKSPYGYSYVVTEENTSHTASKFSYPAYLESQIKASDAPVAMQLQVTADKHGAMLFWDNLQNSTAVIGYKVYRRKKGENELKPISSLISSSRNFYSDTLIEFGNVYEYAVQTALVSGSNSSLSNTVTFAYGELKVQTPTGLMVVKGETGIDLSWNEVDVKSTKEIQIYRAERGASSPLKLGTVAAAENKYVDLTTAKSKSYFYYLTAVGNDGKVSEKSDVKFITVE